MSRETENVLLLLIGVSIAMIAVGGSFLHYVKPSLLPWLIITAVVLIALALGAIISDIRRGGPPSEGGHDGTEHSHRRGIAWLLLAPVVVLIFITPPPLRAQSTTSAMAVTNDSVQQQFPPLPIGRAPELSLIDVVMRAANDKADSLHDRQITVTGFVLNEGDGVDLGRIVIICCAADAQLARIHLRVPDADTTAGLPDNTWVRVEGTVTPAVPQPDKSPIPTLNATSVTRIDAPPNPYAYPH